MPPYLDDGDVVLHLGDCREVMAAMPAESVDAVVCDPPYAFPGGFMGKAWDRMDGREDVGFAYYLSGLIDGEGYFRVGHGERRCEFAVKLRRDDRAILERAQRFIGHGRITDEPARKGSKPQARWVIDTKDGCAELVGFLRRFPLRAKKAIDAEAWCEAVGEWTNQQRGNRWHGPADRTRLRALSDQVRSAREYRDMPWSGHRFQDWTRAWAEEAMRVMKPGGHLLAFGGTRTFHRLTCAIEDAGFEIRDCLSWLYGSGFPKSLDVSKAIDKAAGAEREVVRHPPRPVTSGTMSGKSETRPWIEASRDAGYHETAGPDPATPEAATWQGWGTALKPAWEPIVLARKPLGGTVAANVQATGCGALNVDGCRIAGEVPSVPQPDFTKVTGRATHLDAHARNGQMSEATGRWPANVVLDEEAAARLDGEVGERPGFSGGGVRRREGDLVAIGRGLHDDGGRSPLYGDTGGPSRFFYTAKASTAERDGATHPTVKPLALMRWLVRLVTPPGGLVLDPFAGSGTTLLAAREEGFRAIGIEREEEYAAMAAHRLRQLSLLGGVA